VAETPKWDWSVERFCFLDVETTNVWGSTPAPYLLEAALIVTDGDLQELGRTSTVIRREPEFTRSIILGAHERARDMHTENGLFDELERGNGRRLRDAELLLIGLVAQCCRGVETPLVWAGASPGALDRPILRRDMPRLYGLFHYRTLDVSALKLALENWGKLDLERYDSRHRALSDCEAALDCARRIKTWLGERRHAPTLL
jgi:oligoribonuclease (3'-5' exoribonuclease)